MRGRLPDVAAVKSIRQLTTKLTNYKDLQSTHGKSFAAKVGVSQAEIDSVVTHLYLSSTMTHTEIALYLSQQYGLTVAPSTVNHYLLRVKKRHRERAVQNISTWIEQETAKLDNLELVAVELYNAGNIKDFCKIMVAVAKRRASLLGLDKPIKVHNTGGDDASALTDKQLEALATSTQAEIDKESI